MPRIILKIKDDIQIKLDLVTCIAKVSEQLMVMSLTVSQTFPLIMPNNYLLNLI